MNDRVLIADPAWGNRTLFVNQFNQAWIDSPKFGHIGFTVSNPDASPDDITSNNSLAVTVGDFTVLH